MSDTVFLALAYLRFHWGKSTVIVSVLAVVLAVPAVIAALIDATEARLTARAEATPIVIGAPGSRLDLAMAALHFDAARPAPTTMAAVDAVWESGLADAIPLHLGFRAGAFPIVGTSLDYFDLRDLRIDAGRGLALLGEAVIGHSVASARGLAPGDTIVSSPETLFDLAGSYPLALDIVGVLAPTGSDDDRAVFVDIKTAWVIAGIGHGHDDVVGAGAEPAVADAALRQYNRITAETIDSFHFHGDPAAFPVTAVIARPYDARSATILRGRYLDDRGGVQALLPAEVIGGLIAQVFRVKTALDAVVTIVGLAALAGLGLGLYLSAELRRGEIETAARLGAPRLHAARLLGAEMAILVGAAAVVAIALTAAAESVAAEAVARLIRPNL